MRYAKGHSCILCIYVQHLRCPPAAGSDAPCMQHSFISEASQMLNIIVCLGSWSTSTWRSHLSVH